VALRAEWWDGVRCYSVQVTAAQGCYYVRLPTFEIGAQPRPHPAQTTIDADNNSGWGRSDGGSDKKCMEQLNQERGGTGVEMGGCDGMGIDGDAFELLWW